MTTRLTASDPAGARFDLDAIGTGLVFADALGELAEALRAGGPAGTAVVQAAPGTGKTTLVPPLLANLAINLAAGANPANLAVGAADLAAHAEGPRPRVVVSQPRRVAARSAARRLAALDGSRLGDRVGYTVRGERKAGPETLIEFVTPGILLRRLLADPGLETTSAVILDEVHERGLETDLLLGMLTEVRQLRGDLTLVAMSATLDAPRFAVLIGAYDGGGPAPVVDCPSALQPLEVRWVPGAAPRLDDRGVTRAFLDHVADTAVAARAEAHAVDPDIDALVFLPGAWEVQYVAARLRERAGPRVEVLELHGRIGPAAQDRAVSGRVPGGLPRIIVSTALAESSLTVPGVRLVVDSGLSREPRRDSTRGMSGLVTGSCSRASADQRAGRAARQGPGLVVRCYDQKTFGAAPAHRTPEIAAADLTGAALVLACWGAPSGRGLTLPDAPPQAAMNEAVEVLRELGAVGPDGLATDLGKTLARIPVDPRLARALLDGAAVVGQRAAAETVALVSGDLRAPGADLTRLLTTLRTDRTPEARRWAEDVRRMAAIARQEESAALSSPGPPSSPAVPVTAAESVGFVVALAFPDRVAHRVPGAGREQYLLSSGTRAGLPAGSALSGHEWLAVAEVSRAQGRDAAGTGAVIRSAAALTADTAEAAAGHLLSETVEAVFSRGRVTARRERRLGAIVLSSTPVRPPAEEGRAAVARAMETEGLGMVGWSTAADGLRRRLALLHRELGDPWPDVSERALLARLDEWLAPELEALAGGTAMAGIDLADPLRRLLPWPDAARLGGLAPERLEVPSGSRVRIDYPDVADDAGRPVVAVKLQECFGWAQTPRLVDGRVPVLFHLLSPAGRPLAVTDDLASFWYGPYAQVRAQMRGRYPKHPWPEDPWTAPATARTKNRM
ncbi:ATP-dependent helicase HrpB [Paenarthrobacter sp. PH39-S1]|uniref:ATP-dependent helicase HrpB n=1 Tax=Paenarthrobacter sp. PH39-S1 TaxID=3046204 RepID=UPI0024BA7990|nr:ATP-dependent helicase HrpB [Paenarthrobacter sp. PH39-S1]MDJ0356841.1 ATP-dependent helicase HrpB [Paenarthrobacter sp. PH39-S1]